MTIKIKKKTCVSKDAIEKMKRQHTDAQKTFPNCVSDKRLIPRIHKESTIKKLKIGQKNSRYFTKGVQMANKHTTLNIIIQIC